MYSTAPTFWLFDILKYSLRRNKSKGAGKLHQNSSPVSEEHQQDPCVKKKK